MKRDKLLSMILTVALIFSLGIPAMAANSNEESKNYTIMEPHVYEVVPGTEEWEALTPAERYEVSYVSADVAEKMTTNALIETVLEYPYFINVCFYDTLEEGMEIVSSYFPPLEELLKREDAANALANYSADRSIYTRSGEVDWKAYCVTLLRIAVDDDIGVMIAGEPRFYYDKVYTPEGSAVEVLAGQTWLDLFLKTGLLINDDIAMEVSEQCLDTYPSATIVGDPSPEYNCHSYAWYSTSASNPYWMDDPTAYVTDGSYVRASSEVNNRVTYTEVDSDEIIHSGIITSTTGGPATVTSKWGAYAVFRHDIDDCPYLSGLDPSLGSVVVASWRRS